MAEGDVQQLRVLIANQKPERLELLAKALAGLGREPIARELYVKGSQR
jgi:hypothetical protein